MIITQDKNKNIMLGNLKVTDRKGLLEVRDYLLKSKKELGHYKREFEQLSGFKSILNDGYSKEGNHLVFREITSNYHDDCDYTKETYTCIYRNSILLFTSLLNDLDVSRYDEIAQQFIIQGIIKVAPFESIWSTCARDMATIRNLDERKLKLKDLSAFRAALKSGCITYQVEEEIKRADQNHVRYSMFAKNGKEIVPNNTLILGDNSYIQKQVKKLKK